MITIENLSYRFEKNEILHDINVTLPKGDIIALIGPNGAGKSTLLSVMARILPLQTGRVCIDSLDIAHTSSRELAKKVSILQQSIHFLSRLSLQDLLLFARFPYHQGRAQAQDYAKVEEIIEYFQLGAYRHTFIDELSGGQRQRALVAMVFAQDTEVILLDEPLNNLDMYHAKQLMQLLRQSVRDFSKTIVIVLHDINYALHYADTVVAMKEGRILFSGKKESVLSQENISDLYGLAVKLSEVDGQPICLYF